MNRIRLTRRIALLALHILVGLVLTPLAAVPRPHGGWRTRHRVSSWWHNRLADILGVAVSVAGPRPAAPALLACNHVSWLDIVVLGGLTHTDFLSKDEVRRWPVVGWLAARAGTLFIRRGEGQAGSVSEQIAARLRAGDMLALFPEGTTTEGRDVRPFFSRLFAAAIDTGTAVIPVTLRYHVDGGHDPVAPYTGDQTLLDNLRGLLGREGTRVHVVFGEPLPAQGMTRRALAEQARAAVLAPLQEPLPLAALPRHPEWAVQSALASDRQGA
jgi:1-acyl-sn-glycerol-3-phosphate acyltransferase